MFDRKVFHFINVVRGNLPSALANVTDAGNLHQCNQTCNGLLIVG